MNLWTIIAIAVVALLGVMLALWVFISKKKPLSLQKRSRLLSPAEKSFFECLIKALSDEFYLFSKMSAVDVVKSTNALGFLRTKQQNKFLQGQTFDYVICRKHDLSIYGVIELENFDRANSKRELIVNRVCKAANLKLFYFDVKQNYNGVDVKRLITGKSSVKKQKPKQPPVEHSQMTINDSSYALFSKRKVCAKCNGDVVVKVAVRGDNIGEKFLMCRKYPYCDYRLPLTDKKVIDIKRRDMEENKRAGFNDWS